MQNKLHLILAIALLSASTIKAQTVATFDDVTLPGSDTTYLETISGPDGIYTYQSGNGKFYGKKDFGGSYYARFNCSNHTDTLTPGFGNMWSNVAGEGALNSAHYGIAYVETDYSTPAMATIPVSVKLTGAAAEHMVAGAYFTNSVYAYRYILDNNFYDNGNHSLKLIVRGYLYGAQSADSVLFTLADYSGSGAPVLVNTWEWVDLTSLGNVDSLTFDLISSDAGSFGINTPTYFAIDNLTTLDGTCVKPQNIAATSINENSATIDWEEGIGGLTTNYEIAVDQSQTLAPTAATTAITNSTYGAAGLSSNTQYYVHLRAVCGNAQFSDWDTASFKTLQETGIFTPSVNSLEVSISPNPAADFVQLQSKEAVHAVVYGIEGREVLKVNHAKTIDIRALPAGLYLLKVTDAANTGKQTTLRFTKQ